MKLVGVSAAVKFFVMGAAYIIAICKVLVLFDRVQLFQQFAALDSVGLHYLEFFSCQPSRAQQYGIRYCYLAYIVQR